MFIAAVVPLLVWIVGTYSMQNLYFFVGIAGENPVFLRLVELLLNNGANMNSKHGDRPLLHIAVDSRNRELVSLLLDRGAEVDAVDNNNFTALSSAVIRGDFEISSLLLSRGADMNAAAVDGLTAMHRACYYGHVDIVKLIMSKNFDINLKSVGPELTPLHWATEGGKFEVAKILIDANAQIDAVDS